MAASCLSVSIQVLSCGSVVEDRAPERERERERGGGGEQTWTYSMMQNFLQVSKILCNKKPVKILMTYGSYNVMLRVSQLKKGLTLHTYRPEFGQ